MRSTTRGCPYARAFYLDFEFGRRRGSASPSTFTLTGQLDTVRLQDVAVIRRKNDSAPCRVRLVQNCGQEPYGINAPCQLHLLGLGEVIVYSVQDDADNALSFTAERLSHGCRESLRCTVGQLALVEQARRPARTGCVSQFGLLGESDLLRCRVPPFHATSQKRHA